MKRNYSKINLVIAAVGMAVAVGAIAVGSAYVRLQREIRWHENFGALVDRAYYDQRVTSVLKLYHDGQAAAAVQKLDVVLCGDIIRMDADTAPADSQTRQFALETFRKIARERPKVLASVAGNSPERPIDDQLTAQRVLASACAEGETGAVVATGNQSQSGAK